MIFVLMGNLMMNLTKVQASEQNQTIHIANSADDGFVTEAGIGFDSSLVTILDPNMDIRAWLVFENIKIDNWEPLTNATLKITSASSLDFDNDSSVTVYGMKQANLGGILTDTTTLSPGEVVSMPLTSAFTNVNTSQFYGGAVLDIDVTEIVRELYTNPSWDGDGISGADLGDDMGFIILGAPDETRYFYDYGGDPARSADLIIHWNHAPTPPAGGGTYNETYRDLNLWVTDNLGVNRTGTPPNASTVNWNLLNQSSLSEADSGAAVTVNNATWTTFDNLRAQQIMSLYNDTGGATIREYFVRLAVNITNVENVGIIESALGAVAGISTSSPTGTNGLPWGVAGDWVGLVVLCNVDDQRYRYALRERSGAIDVNTDHSSLYTEGTAIHYIEFQMKDIGAQNWISYKIYSDPGFTTIIEDEIYVLAWASEPFRFPQILSSGGSALNNDRWDGQYYTYLIQPLVANETWTVTFQNGTVIGNSTSYDDAIIIADDFLGADPEDPAPPSQGWPDEGPLTRFQTRLFIWFLGFIMVFGPLGTFAYKRPSGYEFVIGLFIMLMGLGFLIAAGTV